MAPRKISSDQPTASEHPTISLAVKRFVGRVSRGRSRNTGRGYRTGLSWFMQYLASRSLHPTRLWVTRLQAEDFIEFAFWLSGDERRGRFKQATIGTYVSGVLSWLRFLVCEKLHPWIASDVERIRESYRPFRHRNRVLPRTPATADMDRLFAVVRRRRRVRTGAPAVRHLRDTALLESLRSTGARISELLEAHESDLDGSAQALRVMGKGRKERLVFFDRVAWAALSDYLAGRRGLSAGNANVPLFCRHASSKGRGAPGLSAWSVRKILRTYLRQAGIETHMTLHSMRHAFATLVLGKTGDLAATQDLLGHSSPATTRIYAAIVPEQLRKAHRKAFPD